MTVNIYTTTNCKYCKEAKAYMTEKNIPYNEINIEGNPKLIAEVRELSGGTSVPVLLIGDVVLAGFKQKDFDEVYADVVMSEHIDQV